MARVKLRVKHARAVKVGGACYKVKTKSAAKKRFSITATGRVMATQAGKRHNMRKRSCRHLNEQTGCVALAGNVARVVLKYFHLNH